MLYFANKRDHVTLLVRRSGYTGTSLGEGERKSRSLCIAHFLSYIFLSSTLRPYICKTFSYSTMKFSVFLVLLLAGLVEGARLSKLQKDCIKMKKNYVTTCEKDRLFAS